MGVRAVYVHPNQQEGVAVWLAGTTYDNNPILDFPADYEAAFLPRDIGGWGCLTFPPHKTPTGWQPVMCGCAECLEDHAPECKAHRCDGMPAYEVGCDCGLVG